MGNRLGRGNDLSRINIRRRIKLKSNLHACFLLILLSKSCESILAVSHPMPNGDRIFLFDEWRAASKKKNSEKHGCGLRRNVSGRRRGQLGFRFSKLRPERLFEYEAAGAAAKSRLCFSAQVSRIDEVLLPAAGTGQP